MATQTALRNKEIKSREAIADKDRDLEERKFRYQKIKDIAGLALQGASLFASAGKGAAVKAAAAHNDPEFYKAYVSDLDKFTNITAWNRVGYDKYDGQFSGSVSVTTDNTRTSYVRSVPGIAVLHYDLTLGKQAENKASLSTTPINQILMRTKEQVLKSNSRSNVPYEAADLGLNFLATGSIAIMIEEFERAILVAQTYRADNAYYASTMLKALGWSDPNAIINHLPRARQLLILLKKRFNSAIVAPSGLNYYRKLLYLATLWLKDSETSPNQVYTATVSHVWRILEKNSSDDYCSLESIIPSRTTLDGYYAQVSNMIQRIAENPDYVAMYADLRSAFGDKLFQLDEGFSGDATIEERFDPMAMEQIANVQTLPVLVSDEAYCCMGRPSSLHVYQSDTGYLYQGVKDDFTQQGPIFEVSDDPVDSGNVLNELVTKHGQNHLLNFHKTEVTGDDVLDSTRWHFENTTWLGTDDSTFMTRITSCDVVIATHFSIWNLSHSQHSNGEEERFIGTDFVISSSALSNWYEAMVALGMSTSFDWMPLIQLTWNRSPSVGVTQYYTATFGDVQRCVNYPTKNLESINDICVLSLMFINSDNFKR